MALLRRLTCACALAGCVAAATTGAAAAETFYVNQRNGESTPNCGRFPGGHESTKENPCATIHEAIEKTEGTAPPNTIKVSAEVGPFNESLTLTTVRDKDLTIEGEEPGVIVRGHVTVKSPADGITLSNVEIDTASGTASVADAGAGLRLANDTVIAESVTNGVEASGGSLAVEGGKVTLESATGFAVIAKAAPLAVSGTTIFNGEGGIGSESGGISSEGATLAVANARVVNEGSAKQTQFGIVAEKDSSATVRDTTVSQGSPAIGVLFEEAPPTVEGLVVEMMDPAGNVEAIDSEGNGSASFSHVETLGTWTGPAMDIFGSKATISDSHLANNLLAATGAVRYVSDGSTPGLLVQRSVIQSSAKAEPASLVSIGGNTTVDSSEVLGGERKILLESTEGTRLLTVAASTVGPTPGVSFETPGPIGIEAKAAGKAPSAANAVIEGSIVLESQAATAALDDSASVTCSYSAAPSQIQTPDALTHTGEVACPAGTAGNTNSAAEEATLFAEPLHNYTLNPSSSAVDSVPASAVALPFGLTSSTTDLAGKPRVVDGNGDCVAVQDKGALELQGHTAPCPTPISSPAPGGGSTTKPVAAPLHPRPAITALTLSPSAFFAAPFGATTSKAGKRKYGTKVSWHDSMAATTTLTVLRSSPGRRQGKACKKPSRRNRHGKRCVLLSKVGAFSHLDRAGANSVHFSGRFKGRLPAGSYVMQAVPRNAGGAGATVSRSFTVE